MKIILCFFATLVLASLSRADPLDDLVAREMQHHHVPGLSLALVSKGQIISARAYGVTEAGGTTAVTTDTLFQAGSVSKALTAIAALELVEQGKLSLNDDVNPQLKSWKVPENRYTQTQKVTVGRILSHTACFTVHGFGGYERGQPIPALVDSLNGTGGANNPPVRVVGTPGSLWQYSGGGYIVLQQLMLDVTGRPFPDLLSELALKPLQMSHSTFAQPLPDALAASAAAGSINGATIKGQWHVYPEMAAAGLWTTPSDLAQVILAVQQAKQGKTGGAISPHIAELMTTPILNHDGMGLIQTGSHGEMFFHNGRNEGFDTLLIGSATSGVVIMINANDDTGLLNRVARAALALCQ